LSSESLPNPLIGDLNSFFEGLWNHNNLTRSWQLLIGCTLALGVLNGSSSTKGQRDFKKDTFLGILVVIIVVLTCSMILISVPRSLKNNFNFLLILFIYLKIWFFFLTTSKCCWISKATASKLKKIAFLDICLLKIPFYSRQ